MNEIIEALKFITGLALVAWSIMYLASGGGVKNGRP